MFESNKKKLGCQMLGVVHLVWLYSIKIETNNVGVCESDWKVNYFNICIEALKKDNTVDHMFNTLGFSL